MFTAQMIILEKWKWKIIEFGFFQRDDRISSHLIGCQSAEKSNYFCKSNARQNRKGSASLSFHLAQTLSSKVPIQPMGLEMGFG